MGRWTPSSSGNTTMGAVCKVAAVFLLASMLSGCSLVRALEASFTGSAPETMSPTSVAVVTPPVSAANAHCHEVAEWRAGDVERRDYGPAIQDRVFKAAYAECMEWATPKTPAPVTVAFAVSPSPATTVHCHEVAQWRASDAERRDYGPSIQSHVFQAAYTECMQWASPGPPAPVTIALAVALSVSAPSPANNSAMSRDR